MLPRPVAQIIVLYNGSRIPVQDADGASEGQSLDCLGVELGESSKLVH